MGPYREPESSPPFVIVCRPMRPLLLVLTFALMLLSMGAFGSAVAFSTRGLDLQCTRNSAVNACVLTADYGLFHTRRTIDLTAMDSASAVHVTRRHVKNGTVYVVTLTDNRGETVDVTRSVRDPDTAEGARGELAHFLNNPDQPTYTHRVPAMRGFSIGLLIPLVALAAMVALQLRRSEVLFDDARRMITVVRIRWPLPVETASVETDAILRAEVTNIGWGRSRNVSLTLERKDGNSIPVMTRGGDPSYQQDLAAQVNARLGS